MAKIKHEGCIILSADKEHPISSKLCPSGSLEQMGVSGEGFQREVGVHRAYDRATSKYCWALSLYQHPGIRHEIPLGCGHSAEAAPKQAKLMARAWHKLAEAGYDLREAHTGGVPRGNLWHQIMLPALCAKADEKSVVKRLKDHGLWPRENPADATEGLGRSRRRLRRR